MISQGSCIPVLRSESDVKMMVYFKIQCEDTGATYQSMALFDGRTAFGWPTRTQLISELLDFNQLSFSCNFRILWIKNKNGDLIHQYPLGIPSIPKEERLEWNLNEELTEKMATATAGKRFGANAMSRSGLFSITLQPNVCSGYDDSKGMVHVFLILCALPIGVSALTVKYTISTPELGEDRSFTKTLSYDAQSSGVVMGQFQDFRALKSMNITLLTEILEVFDENGSKMERPQFKPEGMI